MQVIKFLVRMLITFLFFMAMILVAIITVYGEWQQVFAWPLWQQITAFVVLILPYLCYLAYTQTKAYQTPQLAFLPHKLLKEVIGKDMLEEFPGVFSVKIGQFWLEVTRSNIITKQKKYIKLDLLQGVCVHHQAGSESLRTGNTTYYFLDVTGKLIVMESCPYVSNEDGRKLEQEIVRRSAATVMPYHEMKAWAKPQIKERNERVEKQSNDALK